MDVAGRRRAVPEVDVGVFRDRQLVLDPVDHLNEGRLDDEGLALGVFDYVLDLQKGRRV